jgi:hypothetical protein
MSMDTALLDYARLKEQKRVIDAQIKEIEESLLPAVENAGGTLDTAIGKFTVSTRTTYRYADSVKEQLADIQLAARAAGNAETTVSTYLRFTEKK